MRARLIGVGAALVVGLAACGGDSPTGPSTNPNARLTALTIDGPNQIAPGETARFTATAVYSDGSRVDVTSSSTWSTTFPAGVLRLVLPGQYVGLIAGETQINARYLTQTSRLQSVLVLPSGTFKLSG